MANVVESKFRVTDDYFDDTAHFTENSLANAYLIQPESISQDLTWIYGNMYKEQFLLQTLTEGIGNVETKTIEGWEYDYPVQGKMERPNYVVTTPSNVTDIGKGGNTFKVIMKYQNIRRQYSVKTKNGYVLRTIGFKPAGDFFEYEFKYVTTSSTATLPATEVTAGAKMAPLAANTAMFDSDGTDSIAAYPSRVKNQIGLLRKGKTWGGNVANRSVKDFSISLDGKTISKWMDSEEWQFQMQWRREIENSLFYSVYNKDENGRITDKDDNGNPIPMGSGLDEQISNSDTYSGVLTMDRLDSIADDLFFGIAEAENKNMLLVTGTGGMRVFDNAAKRKLGGNAYMFPAASDKFIKGKERNLGLTGFFNSYETAFGATINVVKAPILDTGPEALAADTYKGFPRTSYDFYYIDASTYEGKSNLNLVTQKGREIVRRLIPGMATLPASFSGNDNIAVSDRDSASLQYMKAVGLNLVNSTSCYKLKLSM